MSEPIVEGRSGVAIRDLAFLETGRNAVQTASSVRTRGFTLSRCVVGEAGGSTAADGVSRPGNGVRVWSGASDVLISENTIVDCWDTAMTIQGPALPAGSNSVENTIQLAPTTRLQRQRSERIDQRAAWSAATGLERDSTFSVPA
ncbi:hypothetical protein [Curtobacterium luteum]|uniref:hypothetical protein n=1 Tax=Curtobacterium luteum TaxID=33881 RepID=UPI00382A3865